jgi:FkbM family methyltransferase
MRFVSYAQNFEDVILWRVFKNIEKGTYVDVGAQHPIIDSVTYAFYLKGWSGVNIEPSSHYFSQLCSVRQRDVNLESAISNVKGEIDFWEVEHSGLSTADGNLANNYLSSGMSVSHKKVQAITLTDVFEKYTDIDVNFLKIDVEGYEKFVLEGMDLLRFRPWVILIEATEPNTTIDSSVNWDYLLLRHDYFNCYSDGLNKFYLCNEKLDLLPYFKYPPNFFDSFTLANSKYLEEHARELEEHARELEEHARELEEQLSTILTSTSWRFSLPLRLLKRLLNQLI